MKEYEMCSHCKKEGDTIHQRPKPFDIECSDCTELFRYHGNNIIACCSLCGFIRKTSICRSYVKMKFGDTRMFVRMVCGDCSQEYDD